MGNLARFWLLSRMCRYLGAHDQFAQVFLCISSISSFLAGIVENEMPGIQ